ncbi:MAG: Gfo/Idh/MocA family protein [Bacilli bacterium]
MKPIIKVAIVGYGNIAKMHMHAISIANIYMDLPYEIKITTIVTKDITRVKGDIKGYTTLEQAIAQNGSNIDLIDICSINSDHFKALKLGIKHGYALYCEKPLTSSYADALTVLEALKKHPIINHVALIFRYFPNLEVLKKELKTLELGPIINFDVKLYHNSYLNINKRTSWRTHNDAGGGASIDLSIHMIDLVDFLFDGISKCDNTLSKYFSEGSTDEVCLSTITTNEGYHGQIIASRIYHQQQQEQSITIFCEKGSYVIDLNKPLQIQKNYYGGNSITININDPIYLTNWGNPLISGSAHLIAHMQSIINVCNATNGLATLGKEASFKQAAAMQKLLD